MSVIQIFVNLKIPDNIERTALYASRTRLGFESLCSLRRTEFWEIDFPGLSPQRARQTAVRFVEKTSLFANPNKHSWCIKGVERALGGDGTISVPSDVSAFILVCDRDDGKAESTLDAVRRLAPENERPSSLVRGVLWETTFSDLTPDAARDAAEKLAVTVNRSQGLLANPHYQTYRIFYP